MELARRKLLTIVCEANLERELGRDLLRLGAHGYTAIEAHGRGSRGERDAAWGPSANVRVEVVCDDAVAERIMQHVRAVYLAHYAVVMYLTDVEVLRPEKF
ncbi:MAG TPA: DUF3240 family protein [Pelomicrobium sp.]|nr:DUF3240 family protein [Pelomicrobium sp.]